MGKESAKNRILETASQLFHERGYSCVGINEIIEKSGTAKATFYHHFPTKESLCEAWLSTLHTRSEERRHEILCAPDDGVTKVEMYFQELMNLMKSMNFRGCPYTNTAAVTAEHDGCLARQVAEHKQSIRDFFRELARNFSPSAARAREVGDALFLLYSGAATEAQNLKTTWPVEAAQRAAREMCERERA